MIPLRRLLRIVLSLVIVGLVWMRVARESGGRPGAWLLGGLGISLILLLVVFAEIRNIRRGKRRAVDDVPKHPLGL
jgi:hypothetical protein